MSKAANRVTSVLFFIRAGTAPSAEVVTDWNEKVNALVTKHLRYGAFALTLIGACSLFGSPVAAQHAEHFMLDPSELAWKDLPSLPGVKIAVIEGPLDQPVPIMFRLRFPPNFKVMPHWHPGIEHITIISGTLNMGIGSTFDSSKTRALKTGSVSVMQPKTHHYVWTSEETIAQVHSIGPWSVNYVSQADDPVKK